MALLVATGAVTNTLALPEWRQESAGEYLATTVITPEANQTFVFSGKVMFRDEHNDGTHKVLVGVKGFDADGRYLAARNCNPCGSFGTSSLLKNAVKGEAFIYLADNGKDWLSLKDKVIAFNIKADTSDLPNFDLSPLVTAAEQSEGGFKLFFAAGLERDYPAQTPVRVHNLGGYQYFGVFEYEEDQVDEWLPFNVTFVARNLRPGTVTFQPVIIGRGQVAEQSFRFKDISLSIRAEE